MNLKEYIKKDPLVSKYVFGRYIKQYREDNNLTQRELAKELGLGFSYLCDIENGNRRAPLKLVPILKQKFGIKEDELQDFDDMVSLSRGYGFPDISKYLFSHPKAMQAVRLAKEKDLSGEEFLSAVNQVLEEREEKKGLIDTRQDFVK